MEPFTAGTLAGAGSFHCESCGFAIALHELDEVPPCPRCEGRRFKRASLFDGASPDSSPPPAVDEPEWLAETRQSAAHDGPALAFEDGDRVELSPLQEGWTRVGRSMAAHLRFDDPTVSRRHALVHLHEGSARVLDDRSLNGVFVNGERIDWHELEDGDEIAIGRFRLYFLLLSGAEAPAGEEVGTALS